eukprot:scaffold986_cov237-Pinguiococcus_pyrenoidosus.AAC.1
MLAVGVPHAAAVRRYKRLHGIGSRFSDARTGAPDALAPAQDRQGALDAVGIVFIVSHDHQRVQHRTLGVVAGLRLRIGDGPHQRKARNDLTRVLLALPSLVQELEPRSLRQCVLVCLGRTAALEGGKGVLGGLDNRCQRGCDSRLSADDPCRRFGGHSEDLFDRVCGGLRRVLRGSMGGYGLLDGRRHLLLLPGAVADLEQGPSWGLRQSERLRENRQDAPDEVPRTLQRMHNRLEASPGETDAKPPMDLELLLVNAHVLAFHVYSLRVLGAAVVQHRSEGHELLLRRVVVAQGHGAGGLVEVFIGAEEARRAHLLANVLNQGLEGRRRRRLVRQSRPVVFGRRQHEAVLQRVEDRA